jgi:co-chaperonin GroES (HSP10)
MQDSMKKTRAKIAWTAALVLAGLVIAGLGSAVAQAPAGTALPRVNGTVKSASAGSLTVTNAAGQDVAVNVPAAAKVVQVAPGSKDLKSATAATMDAIAVGDKVLVTGTAGDAADSLHATRVVLMKSADIATTRAAQEAAWQHGGGGLVKSVAPGSIVVANGTRTMTVTTTPATMFRRYSGDSVRFEDAVGSTFAEIHPGDQLRVRGARSEDGSTIQADEIVTGEFRNFSGLLASIDSAAGTVTLKDLATKKMVTVKVTANSDVRRIPAEMASRFAARASGPGGGAGAAAGAGASAPAGGGPGAGQGAGQGGQGASARAGMDLSQMLSRLPTETLGGLKVGDAVMIVASQPAADSAQPTAVTVLAGVEPILQAAPKGDMVLTPWSVGGAAPEGGA